MSFVDGILSVPDLVCRLERFPLRFFVFPSCAHQASVFQSSVHCLSAACLQSIRCCSLAIIFLSWLPRFRLCLVVLSTSFLRSQYLLLGFFWFLFLELYILLIVSQMFLTKKPCRVPRVLDIVDCPAYNHEHEILYHPKFYGHQHLTCTSSQFLSTSSSKSNPIRTSKNFLPSSSYFLPFMYDPLSFFFHLFVSATQKKAFHPRYRLKIIVLTQLFYL